MESIWKEYVVGHHAELEKDIKTDVAVVGGGIAGILAAYRLAESGRKVTLLEAGVLYGGVTQNTSAHISALQGYLYNDLKLDQAKPYFESQIKAIDEYERLIKKYDIDCEFQRVDDYLYTVDNPDKIEKEYNALSVMGANPEYADNFHIAQFRPACAFKVPNMALFHPIKFLDMLPKSFEFYERSRVLDIDVKQNILYTNKAKVKADKIVIATNFPIINIPGWYFLRMYKSQAYTIAIDNVKTNIQASYQSELANGLTFRNYGKYLIIDGLSHRTGRINANDKFQRLEDTAKKLFPQCKVTHKWTANDCVTYDSLPFVGYYSKTSKDIYVITGFNKWGMANAMVSSMIICDMINGKNNEYEELFSPQRCSFKFKPAMSNILCTVKNLVVKPLCPAVKGEDSLPIDSGGIVRFNGKKKAVYKDADGVIYACQPLCAHLKCQLVFNANTKTWDCPCHGSRFDIYGNIIVAPAKKELCSEIVKNEPEE